jgi:tRNA threonylcarbamoyladenosine biosynthesis protein TsaE
MPEVWELVEGGRPLSLREVRDSADVLLKQSENRRVWLFYGEMGAGKTTLIKKIAENLGVSAGMSSPTFSIVNEYKTGTGDVVYHFDFYRIESEVEAFDIGTDEYFDSGHFCFVEWPERIPSLIPPQRMEIKLSTGPDPDHRILQYARHD